MNIRSLTYLSKVIRKISFEFEEISSNDALNLISKVVSHMQIHNIELKRLEVNGGNIKP